MIDFFDGYDFKETEADLGLISLKVESTFIVYMFFERTSMFDV
jgi:hypothetical protein